MLPALVDLTWTCLIQTPFRNGLFKQLFFEKAVLSEMASAASLDFCPGLLEAAQAASPPTTAFFKKLPPDNKERWGIYAIVLQKEGLKDCVYIGSATNARGGVRARLLQYEYLGKTSSKHNIPKFVRQAMGLGYSITHKRVLMSCPIPLPADRSRYRLMLVAMEATLSFLFWTIRSSSKDYGMSACCPWDIKSFTYQGLCSHNALCEYISGNFDLSAEELETLAAHIREARRQWQHSYYTKLKVTKPEHLKAQNKAAYTNYHTKSHAKELAKNHRTEAKAKASLKYYCHVCKLPCAKPYHLAKHQKSKLHKENVRKAEAGIVDEWRCEICHKGFSDKFTLARHKKCKRHKDNVARAKAKSKSSSCST